MPGAYIVEIGVRDANDGFGVGHTKHFRRIIVHVAASELAVTRASCIMNRCKFLPSKDQRCFTDFSLGVSLPNVFRTGRWKVEVKGGGEREKWKRVVGEGGENWWSMSSNPNFKVLTGMSTFYFYTSHLSISSLCHVSNILRRKLQFNGKDQFVYVLKNIGTKLIFLKTTILN